MPPKAIPKIPFTFGIELEFVFAADEPAFRKDPTYLKPLAISNSTLLATLQKQVKTSEKVCAIDRVSRILQRSGLNVLPQLVPHFAGDYSQWQVTYDASVRLRMTRVKTVDIVKDCAASIAKISNTKGWGTNGIELVSRVLPLPASRADASLAEVGQYVGALGINPELEDPWLAIGKLQSAGLHVHIGVAPEKTEFNGIPLPVLQELAFLLAQYEQLISYLHNPSRRVDRGDVHRAMLNTNLSGLGCAHGVRRNLDEVHNEIFAPAMTVSKVATLMSKTGRGRDDVTSRFKNVNFTNMIDHSSKKLRTLEFRQHSGTLQAGEIEQWVWFLTRLLRTAEALAADRKKRKSSKSRKTVAVSQTRTEVLTELMQLIKLDSDAQAYWRNKLCKENPKDAGLIMKDEVCLKCAKLKAVPNKRKRADEEVPMPVKAESKRARDRYALRSRTPRTTQT